MKAVVSMLLVMSAVSLAAQSPRLTLAQLNQLETTSNDPAGDSFTGTPAQLGKLVDQFVSDNSLASPLYLLFAANTASRLGRVEDAAFLLYAAQIRRAFDVERVKFPSATDARDAGIYMGFLNETTGAHVNPVVMRQPKLFAIAITRIEGWNAVPSTQAYYPEFEGSSGFKLAEKEWAGAARKIKDSFLAEFGRPMTALLNDAEYF